MSSRVFGSRGPRRPHLVQGPGGLAAEVRDLRGDTEAAFLQMEEEGATNTVTWAPYLPPSTAYFTTWEEAVAEIQKLKTPTTVLQIVADPDSQTVYIPAGTWQLKNTTIVGKAVGAELDGTYDYTRPFRGYEELLRVEAESNSTEACHILGCVGLKDLYFRGNETSPYTSTTAVFTTPAAGDTVDISVSSGDVFSDGMLVYIDGAGYYRVVSGSGTSTLTVRNLNFAGNTGSGSAVSSATVYADSSVFRCNGWYSEGTTFTLDNADFRFGYNYLFGTLHVEQDSGLFIHMKGNASIRWYALQVNGYAVIQSDGGNPWLGYYAFWGEGNVDVVASSGLSLRSGQPGINTWYLYQGFTVYTPDNTGHWAGSAPRSIAEAIDRLATAVKALGGNP